MKISEYLNFLTVQLVDLRRSALVVYMLSFALGVFEVCYIYGMSQCIWEEGSRLYHCFSAGQEWIGGSPNVRLWRSTWQGNDQLVADLRTHTKGWWKLSVNSFPNNVSNAMVIVCGCVDDYSADAIVPRRGVNFCTSVAMENGQVKALAVHETMRPEYVFKNPENAEDRHVFEFDDQGDLFRHVHDILNFYRDCDAKNACETGDVK